jgi:hypothetical protein
MACRPSWPVARHGLSEEFTPEQIPGYTLLNSKRRASVFKKKNSAVGRQRQPDSIHFEMVYIID